VVPNPVEGSLQAGLPGAYRVECSDLSEATGDTPFPLQSAKTLSWLRVWGFLFLFFLPLLWP